MNHWPAQQISVHALRELQRWQEIAAAWPLQEDRLMLRCGECGQCAVRTHDQRGLPYRPDADARLVQIVAHLRQCHREAILAGG